MGSSGFEDASTKKTVEEIVNGLAQSTLVTWAADCAERALPNFEAACPEDSRPRSAIEAARAWVRGEIRVGEARAHAFAAHAAARDVDHAAARAAARAAGHAAATAHVSGHAVHAAGYAVIAASCAADAMEADAVAIRERDWQYRHLIELRDKS